MKISEVLINLIEECNNAKSVSQLHSQALKTGTLYQSFYATKLNALYAKHISIKDARKLFDETPHRTSYLSNAMLKTYCKDRQWEETLRLFRDEKADRYTIPVALKACAGLRVVNYGEMVHGVVMKNEEFCQDVFVGTSLVEMYSRCGQMGNALKVFKEFSMPDVVMWTLMFSGFELNGCPGEALEFFKEMVVGQRLVPDVVALLSLVSACVQLLDCRLGRCVHGFVIRKGLDDKLSLVNSILNLYVKTGSVKMANNLFRRMKGKDVISWSSILACYTQSESANEILDLLGKMIASGIEPNEVTVVSALQACSVACNLDQGIKIHELVSQKGFEMDTMVSTALIDMYMNCLSPEKAVAIFGRMPKKDVISWAALLRGYAQNGMADKSMAVFRDMLSHQVLPDAVAISNALAACSELGILQQASCLHGYVIKSGFGFNMFVGASLIELYSKCGSLESSIKVFSGINEKDVVTWSAMIASYGSHGQGKEALRVFNQMSALSRLSVVKPNSITFLSVLSACSHAGLVEEGIKIFQMMIHEYQLNPTSEHFGIMVDLFGRRGKLDEAMAIINKMPIPARPHVWGALLGACRIHHNVAMGEVAAKNILCLDPDHAGYYILLSNIYALDRKWKNVAELKSIIKEKRLIKNSGQSVVEISSEVHNFVAGDRSHPESLQIHRFLKILEEEMRVEDYLPESKLLLQSVGYRENVDIVKFWFFPLSTRGYGLELRTFIMLESD